MKKNEDLIQIYLIRHGEAEKSWEEDSDPGLSDLGKQQSKEIIEIMIEELKGKEFRLLTSPLKRAQQTAMPLQKFTGINIEIDETFAEIPSPGIPLKERKEWLKNLFDKNLKSFEGVQENWMQLILKKIPSINQNTVIFTHFMVINCLVSWLENKETMVNFYPDNCSITKLEISNGLVSLSKKGEELKTIVQ